jgi:hypothetical protein
MTPILTAIKIKTIALSWMIQMLDTSQTLAMLAKFVIIEAFKCRKAMKAVKAIETAEEW